MSSYRSLGPDSAINKATQPVYNAEGPYYYSHVSINYERKTHKARTKARKNTKRPLTSDEGKLQVSIIFLHIVDSITNLSVLSNILKIYKLVSHFPQQNDNYTVKNIYANILLPMENSEMNSKILNI
jgi:hypothetical protein